MDKMTKKILGAFVAILVIAACILAVFFFMNKQAKKEAEDNVLPTTEVGKLLAKDLETKYPETPTEVVKLYWRINRCMYNKDTSDKEEEKLLKQMCNLYDEEFLQDGNKVRVSLRFNGREIAHQDLGREMLDKFAEACSEYGAVDKKPVLEGRQITMFVVPSKTQTAAK